MADKELAAPPPEHCPGTQSERAGKESACAGCPNQKICASGKPKAPDPDIAVIQERMEHIKRKILVLSGKGGVGKSTFSSQFALHLAGQDKDVGLLDVDICGPSIPTILGLTREEDIVHHSATGWEPVYKRENLAVMSVGFLLKSPDEAVIWRGPKKNQMIKNFLKDVTWDELDYLIVDTPPGTSDEHISICSYLKKAKIDGAVLITTPQEVALMDVRKEISFCRKVGINIIGVVENMSGFVCPKCNTETQIFAPTTGGAKALCEELDLTFLGAIPIDPYVARACDEGKSYLELYPDSASAKAFCEIIEKITENVEKL